MHVCSRPFLCWRPQTLRVLRAFGKCIYVVDAANNTGFNPNIIILFIIIIITMIRLLGQVCLSRWWTNFCPSSTDYDPDLGVYLIRQIFTNDDQTEPIAVEIDAPWKHVLFGSGWFSGMNYHDIAYWNGIDFFFVIPSAWIMNSTSGRRPLSKRRPLSAMANIISGWVSDRESVSEGWIRYCLWSRWNYWSWTLRDSWWEWRHKCQISSVQSTSCRLIIGCQRSVPWNEGDLETGQLWVS